MIRFLCRHVVAVMTCIPFCLGAAQRATAQTSEDETPIAHWIWSDSQSSQLSAEFDVDSPPVTAHLRFAAMSASLEIAIDGTLVAIAEPFSPIQHLDCTHHIKPGKNLLSVAAVGTPGPSGFFARLEWVDQRGKRHVLVSDATWKDKAGQNARDLGEINRRLVIPRDRRVGIDVTDNYEQWKLAKDANQAADPAKFSLTPGFEIQLVRSAQQDEGSWVSMAFDPVGRLLIAREDIGLLRMTLSPDGSSVVQAELVESTLKECRGLQFIGQYLYANANNSKALYRLRVQGNEFSPPEKILETSGGVGHGRNDLATAPDGMLYSIHGDSVDLLDGAGDLTSPLRDSRRDRAPNQGHLVRIDPESGEPTITVSGLRNPFGVDFNAHGEPFTYDADAEYDMGSPWYRPTRVHHLATGGDYGWRALTKQWPSYYHDRPDNAQVGLDIGKGSPTAVKFAAGTQFPPPYDDALFILDWAYGRIIAVHMVPCGSSYLMSAETFLKGRPLNVTDLGFGPDGSMYFVTGGRKTQSSLYRVRYSGNNQQVAKPQPSFERETQRYAAEMRALRRQLENDLSQPASPEILRRAWEQLSHHDPRIRYAARNVVEHQPARMWKGAALSEDRPWAAITALTALARTGDPVFSNSILKRLNEWLPRLTTPSQKEAAFYVYWLCLQDDEIDSQVLRKTSSLLENEYPVESRHPHSRAHNRLLSDALVLMESLQVIEKTIALMNATEDQAEQMHCLYVLRNVASGWSIEQRSDYFATLAQAGDYRGGAGMPDFLNRIRQEAISALSDKEKEQLGAMLEFETVTEETVVTKNRKFVRKWTVADVLRDSDGNRDKENGARVFAEASCSQCHRFRSRGRLVGPDLTSVGSRFSRSDLLQSILEPSQVIAEKYRSLQVVTLDGKTYSGQASHAGDYRSPILQLATDPQNPLKRIQIDKTQIESQRWSDVSWMPQGLMDTFTQEEILDLLEYLSHP